MERRRLVVGLASVVVLVVWALCPLGEVPLGAQAPSVAIRGATLVTVTNGTIPNGTVVLRDGKIAAVGTNVAIPPDAEVVDATGKFVSPGLIDAHSHIAVDGINEGGTTVSSMTGIEDVLDPTDINIYRDLAGGLTTALILHGSANPIGGTSAVIKLRWGKTRAEELLFDGAMPGIKFALGENPKRNTTRPGPPRYPDTRLGVEFVIRDAFTRAKAYQRAWQDYERRKQAGEDVIPPRRDLQLEPLVEILEGRRLVHSHCYRADEILMLIRLADEMGFKIATFQHVLEGYKVANEIAAHGAGASTFATMWGYKIEAIDAIPHNAALMTRRGIVVSINSDSPEFARRLNTEAAKSVKWGGLSDDEVLALVTINPARQLRIDDRVGSLELGKDADVVIWTHHPLSNYAIVERTYIDGQLYYDRQGETQRLTLLREEKSQLVSAEGAAGRAPTAAEPQAPPRVATPPSAGNDNGEPAGTNGGSLQTAGQRSVVAITNATIHPVTQPMVERGTIVIRDGTIAAVGANVPVPADAEVIDADGADVYPGWINARSMLGLQDPGASGFADTDEMLDFNPQLRSVVAFHNDSVSIPVTRANGVTTVAVTPSGGLLGGQVAVMNLDGWTWEESTVKAYVGSAFQFPSLARFRSPFAVGPDPDRDKPYEDLKKDRDAKLDELAELLEQTRAYAKAGSDRATDWVLEALLPVVEGELPLLTRADSAANIRDAIAFAERVGVRLVISGGLEAPLVAQELAEKDIPVIFGPVLTLPTREDLPHAATYAAPSELARAGVKFAFTTGEGVDTQNARLLPYHAAQAVAWGLDRDEAIRALTIHAAEILGVADRLGSIERGKMANLVIAKGDPLQLRTEITHVLINGRDVGLGNKQQALYERYGKRP